MVTIAQAHVLVDTGTLQKSIRKEQAGNVVSVKAGGMEYINPKTLRGCDYARHVEARWPFMAQAYATVEKLIDDLIKTKVLEVVKQ